MKKSTLIKLHLYCGLFTCFYLIAFGVSSLVLNHDLKVENTAVKRTWTDQVAVDAALADQALAENVRDQLGLMGWAPPWEYQKDSLRFAFSIVHLARTSRVTLDLATGQAEVAEIPKGFVAVLHGLHFFNGRIPNAPFFLKTWMVYQWLTLLVLLASLVLGLWLWIRYSHKTWELYVFGGLFVFSLVLMLLL